MFLIFSLLFSFFLCFSFVFLFFHFFSVFMFYFISIFLQFSFSLKAFPIILQPFVSFDVLLIPVLLRALKFCIDVSNMYICMAFPTKPTKHYPPNNGEWKMKKWSQFEDYTENNEKMKNMKNEKHEKHEKTTRLFFLIFWIFLNFLKNYSQSSSFWPPWGSFRPSLALALVWPCSSFWPLWGSLLAFRSLAMPASRTQNGKHISKSGRTSLEPLGLGIVCE